MVLCKKCGIEFTSKDKRGQIFCSRACYYLGREIWNKGKKLGYIPRTAFKKGQNLGSNHPNWKGGKWCWIKRKVIEKYKGTCQNCGLVESQIMDVAHIIPVKSDYKRRYVPQKETNLVLLCPNCHRRYDKGLIKLK